MKARQCKGVTVAEVRTAGSLFATTKMAISSPVIARRSQIVREESFFSERCITPGELAEGYHLTSMLPGVVVTLSLPATCSSGRPLQRYTSALSLCHWMVQSLLTISKMRHAGICDYQNTHHRACCNIPSQPITPPPHAAHMAPPRQGGHDGQQGG